MEALPGLFSGMKLHIIKLPEPAVFIHQFPVGA